MDLIVGATGYLGSEISRLLALRGRSVRGMVRDNSPVGMIRKLKANSVELCKADLKDRLSLQKACAGVHTILSTATALRSTHEEDDLASVDYRGQLNLIEAAQHAGVKRFIFISYPGMVDGDDPGTLAKRAVEKRLKTSGLDYTIIRPAFLMEFWLSPAMGFNFLDGKATIYGSGENKISWVSIQDVAQFTIDCIDSPVVKNQTVELGGGDSISPLEVVRIFELVSARPFDIQFIPAKVILNQTTLDFRPLQQAYLNLLLAFARGQPVQPSPAVHLINHQATTIREYAKRMFSTIYPVSTQLGSMLVDQVNLQLY